MHFGWNDMGFELCEGKRFSSSPNCPDLLWGTSRFLFNGQWVLSRGRSVRGLMLTTHLHLTPKFGMSRATAPIPLDAFMARTETILPYNKLRLR
jgi:hypothetical protein